MKPKLLKSLLLIALLLTSNAIYAYDFEVDGIYYNKLSDGRVSVTYRDTNYNSYSGNVIIPDSISVENNKYKVYSISESAFRNCINLKSVLITEGITSVEDRVFYRCTGLISITLPNTINGIGDYAFWGCSGLTCVTIPNSVTSIGKATFNSCSGLTSVTIGNSVTSIGSGAFANCTGLTRVYITDLEAWCKIDFGAYSANPLYYANNLYLNNEKVTNLVIPNTITKVKDYAFHGCSSLTSVTIPNSVTNIGTSVFEGCSGLTSIDVEMGNKIYDSRNNCNAIIETATNKIMTGCKNTMIPESVTAIGEAAFKCNTELTNIMIPNSVISIGNSAFACCNGLTSVTIGNSVTSIGESAFSGCTELTNITIPNSVTCIEGNVFEECSGLTNIIIPNSVVSIGSAAFRACSGLTNIIIPNSVVSIGSAAFRACSGLTSIIIPNTVKNIEGYAFYGCSGLKSVTIPNSITTIMDYTFYDCSNLTNIVIPESVTLIRYSAFANKNNYITRTIVCNAKNPPRISPDVFDYNRLILEVPFTSVLAYKAVESWNIGNITYKPKENNGLYYLPTSENEVEVTYKDTNYNSYSGEVVIPDTIIVDSLKYDVTSIGNNAFRNCVNLTNVTFHKSVTSIGSLAFSGCTSLPGTIILPDSLTQIGTNAFSNTITKIYRVNATTPPTITSNSLASGTSLILVPAGCADAYKADEVWGTYNIIVEGSCDVEVNNETAGGLSRAILTQVRKNLNNITSLKVNGTLNEDDFEKINTNMTSILHLDITDTDVTEIPANAFTDKATLMAIRFPKRLKKIGDYAFSGCNVLSSKLELPDSLETIGNYAFRNCALIDSILTLPSSVTDIGNYAFSGCLSIKSIDMSKADNLTTLNPYAFANCTDINSVNMTGTTNLKVLNSNAFYGCTSLQTVNFSESLEFIGDSAFSGCKKLDNVVMPDSIRYINSNAFYGCVGMSSIDFSACSSLNSISSNAFSGCTSLSILDLSACENLIQIDDQAFNSCSSLETINFPTSLSSIGSNAFANCTNLLHLSVPCTVPPVIANNAEPFAGVDNIACILSIPTDNFIDYYEANYWGGFVDVENKGEIQNEVNNPTDEESGDEETDNTTGDDDKHHDKHHGDGCHIHYKKDSQHDSKPKAMPQRSRNILSTTEKAVNTSDMGLTGSGQSLFAGFGESVTFYLTPEDGKEVESVYFNGEDVTSQLVNNTYTVTIKSDIPMTNFVVNLKNTISTIKGDINNDGEVNVTDVVTLYSYILGNTTDVSEEVADINSDGEVNVTDIVNLYSIILNSNN